MVIDLPRDVKDVLVADPKIANAVVRSSRRAYLIGVAVGQTNVFFFDADGAQIAGFDIAVTRDLNGVRAALQAACCRMPTSRRRRRRRRHAVRLGGERGWKPQQAFDLAARLAGDANKVVNGITVRGRDQVMLKVTVAEVQRDVIKQLGIDLSGSLSYGTDGAQLQQRQSVPGARPGAGQHATRVTGTWQAASARRCARWSAPA